MIEPAELKLIGAAVLGAVIGAALGLALLIYFGGLTYVR